MAGLSNGENPVPGRHITDQQAKLYMTLRRSHHRQTAAAKACFSASTAARLDADPRMPSQKRTPRGRRRADPLEPFNRGVFWVNDKLYFYLLKPIARGYRVVPAGVRSRIGNAFNNLAFPIRFVNSLLQLKFRGAAVVFDRFLINSGEPPGEMST